MQYFDICFWIVLGLIIGSFVNVCLDRFPLQFADEEKRLCLLESPEIASFLKQYIQDQSLTLFKPARSFCFYCGHQLQWFENIPLLSYLLIKGRCRTCNSALGFRMFWTEAIHGLWYGIFGWVFQGWIWSLFVSIDFSFLWILAYCHTYQQFRIKLYCAGGILLVLNFSGYLFIKE